MMSTSSNKVDKEEKVDKALKPEWLQSFLGKTFFDSCTIHPVHKNELNKYCITCNQQICQYCASDSTHRLHETLKIYRHNFKDVVSLDAMEKHIDCSEIQPYRSNRMWIIALEPLPHCGSGKWREATSCDICVRKLVNPNLYRYCSISCKVQAVSRKPDVSVPPFIFPLKVIKRRKLPDQPAGKQTKVNTLQSSPVIKATSLCM